MHELRRPLQALLLSAPSSDRQITAVDLAIAAMRDLERVLDGKGDRSQDQTAATVAWADLLSGAAERWQQAAWLRGGRIRTHLQVEPGRRLSKTDSLALAQVLDNLIFNALTHGGASVDVTLEPNLDGLLLKVADNGPPPGPAPAPVGPRRRHRQGLKIVAETLDRLGGRFELQRQQGHCEALVRLPATAIA